MLCPIYKPELLGEIQKIWVIYAFILYILLVGFQCIIFVRVGLLVKKKRQEIQCLGGQVIQMANSISSFKASLRLVMFFTSYTIMWLPYIIFDTLTQFPLVEIQTYDTCLILYIICLNVAYLNSFINIFGYAASDPTFPKFFTSYTIMWLPYIIFDTLTQFPLVEIQTYDTCLILYIICLNVAYLNSFINIFGYAASEPTFRKTAKTIFQLRL